MGDLFYFLSYFGNANACMGICDPATLTYVVQIIAGVFIAGGVAVGVYWRKIKKLFSKDKTSVKKHESTEQERNAAAAAADEFNEDK